MLYYYYKKYANFIAAFCTPLLAFAIQYLLWQFIDPFAWILFYPAIFISSRIGSFKAGVIATFFSAVIVWFFFLTPQHSFKIENLNNIFSMLIFVFVGLIISNLHEQLRKATKRGLVDVDNKYRYVLENMLEGCQILNKNWQYVYINASAESQNRIKREDLIGRRYMDIWPGIDETSVYHEMKKCMDEQTSSNFENEFTYPDKTIGWFEISICPVPEGIFIHSVDITARKKVEERMLKTEEELKKAQSIAEIGYWTWYINENRLEWSDVMYSLFGIDKVTFNGRLDEVINDSIHPDDREKVNASNLSVMEGGVSIPLEYRAVLKDGTIRYLWAEAGELILDNDGKPLMLKGIVQDITHRKLAEHELVIAKEKAEENDRFKTAFLANMSHEIRTPINAIVGFSNMLVNRELDADKRETFTKMIQLKSFDLLHIIDDILDISKIEAGQMIVNRDTVNVTNLLTELFVYYQAYLSSKLEKTDVKLKLVVPDRLKALKITTDPFRLKQVLGNLIDNALKFTESGDVEFGIKRKSDTEITFYVKDSGIGIDPSKQDIIFDRFWQVEDALSNRIHSGTGLGLSIVKGILDLFECKINVNSELGAGATFYFDYSLVKDEENIKPASANNFNTITWKEKTILIVEDDRPNAMFLIELLRDADVKLLFAFNGTQALEVFKLNPEINLVLMDIRLPDISGLELTRTFKEQNPNVRIIAQSAFAQHRDIKECYDAGCNNFVSKPINIAQLFDLIDRNFAVKS